MYVLLCYRNINCTFYFPCFPLCGRSSFITRYEVAPRSDSEESGSEFEEEVCDFLINELPRWRSLNQPHSPAVVQIIQMVIKWDLVHISVRLTQHVQYIHTLKTHIKLHQGAVVVCTSVALFLMILFHLRQSYFCYLSLLYECSQSCVINFAL